MVLRTGLATAAWAAALWTASAGGAAAQVQATDQRGEVLRLAAPPQRVVAIPIPSASMVVAVDGSPERLAGMHASAKAAMQEAILGRIFPSALAVPSDMVGQNFVPNVEQLLAVRPDLVIQWGDRGPDIVRPIEAVGIPVAGLSYGTEDDARAWLTIMGDLFGRQERAARLNAWRADTEAAIRSALDGVGREERPKVLYFLRYLSDLRVAGPGTYNDFVIDLAGGRNAARGIADFKTVNAEQIVAWDPDVILLNSFEAELSPDDVYANPLLAGVTAVRERRVYKMPMGGYRWDPPNQESPLTWEWLAGLLHPDRIEGDLRARMRDAYRVLYRHELAEAEIDGILWTDDRNAGAAGYDRFRAR
jgi:iron complex transport system substrate-binding protein